MDIKTYWVGDRPGGAWVFQVLNQRTGQPEVLTSYVSARAVMADSDNNIIRFDDANTVISNPNTGTVTFLWPDKSVFTKPGRYVMQLELEGLTTLRKTTVQEILVRELGGITR